MYCMIMYIVAMLVCSEYRYVEGEELGGGGGNLRNGLRLSGPGRGEVRHLFA